MPPRNLAHTDHARSQFAIWTFAFLFVFGSGVVAFTHLSPYTCNILVRQRTVSQPQSEMLQRVTESAHLFGIVMDVLFDLDEPSALSLDDTTDDGLFQLMYAACARDVDGVAGKPKLAKAANVIGISVILLSLLAIPYQLKDIVFS